MEITRAMATITAKARGTGKGTDGGFFLPLGPDETGNEVLQMVYVGYGKAYRVLE